MPLRISSWLDFDSLLLFTGSEPSYKEPQQRRCSTGLGLADFTSQAPEEQEKHRKTPEQSEPKDLRAEL